MNYAEAAQTALSLIADAGAVVAIRRVVREHNEVTGQTDELVKETGVLTAVILPLSSTPKGILTEADNNLIDDFISGKLRYILAAAAGASFEPAALDIIEIQNETFVLRGCSPLSPAGVPILFKMVAEIAPATPTSATANDLAELESAAENLGDFVES